MKQAEKQEEPLRTKAVAVFELEELLDKCVELFGVSSCVFQGATNGMVGKFSVEEIRKRLNEWKKKQSKASFGKE